MSTKCYAQICYSKFNSFVYKFSSFYSYKNRLKDFLEIKYHFGAKIVEFKLFKYIIDKVSLANYALHLNVLLQLKFSIIFIFKYRLECFRLKRINSVMVLTLHLIGDRVSRLKQYIQNINSKYKESLIVCYDL